MTYPFSASEISRVKTCLGTAVLPRVRRTTPGMRMGTIRHRFLQRLNELGGGYIARDKALHEVEDQAVRDVLAAIETSDLPLDPSSYVAEIAVAWDWETDRARELHRGGERDYSMVGPTEIVGTADGAGLIGTDTVDVFDYKPEFGYQPAARDHEQLLFLSMALARLWRADGARLAIIRPRKDEPAWRDRAELDAFDLAEIAEETRELALRVIAARAAYARDRQDLPELHVTEACSRCPCAHACPAQGQALAMVIAPEETALTIEVAGRAWHWIKAAEARIKEYKETLRAYAWQQGGIPLGDGRIYGPQRRNNNVIDGGKLFHVLKELHGEDTAWAASEIKISQEALRDALREVATKTGAKVTHLMRDVQSAGEAADGAWRVVPDEEVRVFKAPKEPR